jgi:hypothetical protein
MNDFSAVEILITIVVLGLAIYFSIPFYKDMRDARGKKSKTRGLILTLAYCAFGFGMFYLIFAVPLFMSQYTDSVILRALPLVPLTVIYLYLVISFYNYLNGAKGREIFRIRSRP